MRKSKIHPDGAVCLCFSENDVDNWTYNWPCVFVRLEFNRDITDLTIDGKDCSEFEVDDNEL